MSTIAKYYRVKPEEQKKADKPDTDIIMKHSSSYGRYVGRGLTLFFGEDKNAVTIKAAERLIEKALWVAEVLKRKVADLHQITTINEQKIVDIYQPIEEGLLRVEKERYLTIVEVVLTRKPTEEQKKAAGYQAPLKNIDGEFLNKESWARGEKERAERRESRPERSGDRPERRDREERGGEREERGERPQRREERGERPQRREERGERPQRREWEDRGDTRGGERRRGGPRRD